MVVAQFTHQYVRLQYPQDVHFGDDISIWIAKAGGDVARRNMILQVTWPQTCAVDNSVGTRMIDFLELLYDDTLIERHYGESIEIHNDLCVPQGKQAALTTFTGKGITSNLASYAILLPLSIDLPLCALDKAPVLRVKFRPSLEFSTINWTQPIQVNLFVDYIYVSKAERDYLRSTPVFYPTQTLQRLIFTAGANVNQCIFLTQFTRMVKELYWVIQTDGEDTYNFLNQGQDQLVNLNLQFNNVDVIPIEVGTPLFLHVIQPLELHTRVPNMNFYMYSFALDPESKKQTGEVNFGSILRQLHTLNLTPCAFSRQVRVYALSYNVLQLRNGALVSMTDAAQEGGTQIS
jgi:hypothetical protein